MLSPRLLRHAGSPTAQPCSLLHPGRPFPGRARSSPTVHLATMPRRCLPPRPGRGGSVARIRGTISIFNLLGPDGQATYQAVSRRYFKAMTDAIFASATPRSGLIDHSAVGKTTGIGPADSFGPVQQCRLDRSRQAGVAARTDRRRRCDDRAPCATTAGGVHRRAARGFAPLPTRASPPTRHDRAGWSRAAHRPRATARRDARAKPMARIDRFRAGDAR